MSNQPLELTVDEEVTLRQFMVEDADTIFALIDRNRKRLSKDGVVAGITYQTVGDVIRSIVAPSNSSRLRFGIWANSKYTGTINLTPKDTKAEIGYYLGEEFEGRGYVIRSARRLFQYSFDELKLSEVYAKIHPKNKKSIALVQRLGFTLDGAQSTQDELYFSLPRPLN
ncbi:MAG: GNAT family N-acetyltransferase [Nanoarchaeota archaeon]